MFLSIGHQSAAQKTYYPPYHTNYWETQIPSSYGYCQDEIHQLFDFLKENNTKAFILLKNGKIILEKYFGNFTKDSSHQWGSASETLTAYLIGIAQSNEQIALDQPIKTYLGDWVENDEENANNAKVKDLLSMTSGLEVNTQDPFCIEANCLAFSSRAGSKWEYNPKNHLLAIKALEKSTDLSINRFLFNKLRGTIGLTGSYNKNGSYHFNSNPRSMAKFGLLLMEEGKWNGHSVIKDSLYFMQLKAPSQKLNPSYGLMTWINGKDSYISPQTNALKQETINPDAPEDLFASISENGQLINVAPSEKLVWIRMGEKCQSHPEVIEFNNQIWSKINALSCGKAHKKNKSDSSTDFLKLSSEVPIKRIMVSDQSGKIHYAAEINSHDLKIALNKFEKGSYFAKILFVNNVVSTKRFSVP